MPRIILSSFYSYERNKEIWGCESVDSKYSALCFSADHNFQYLDHRLTGIKDLDFHGCIKDLAENFHADVIVDDILFSGQFYPDAAADIITQLEVANDRLVFIREDTGWRRERVFP